LGQAQQDFINLRLTHHQHVKRGRAGKEGVVGEASRAAKLISLFPFPYARQTGISFTSMFIDAAAAVDQLACPLESTQFSR